MPPLLLKLKKSRDARPNLCCVRADGSRTWARVHPFFPTHDLTHCALESLLGLDQAFFGLIAQGLDLDDFELPGTARRLPLQAQWAEHLVGLLERRVATDAAGLNAALADSLPPDARPPQPLVSEPRLAEFRGLRAKLIAAWESLPVGEPLRVAFPADVSCATTT